MSSFPTRVLSIQDLNYSFQIHTSYMPQFADAAQQRIMKANSSYAAAIDHAFKTAAMQRVWGILLECDGQPMFVAQNLACRVRNSTFRRILKIDISNLVHNNQSTAAALPLI